jgi:hypothetical protein
MKRNKELLYLSQPVLTRFKQQEQEDLYWKDLKNGLITNETDVDTIISLTFNY